MSHVELIGGPFDGKWLLSPDAPSVWIRRRDDGFLGYLTEPAPDRERYDVEDERRYRHVEDVR